MNQLPSSIETYLEEAGFSGTEILILRRLMEGEPLTIRQLGAKTGKSTGVLDQAMKKLIKKNIIKRTVINDAPKYALDSLESVVEWMEEDMEQKREMLLRRHQNFESFVTSLESGSKRPDIEYFEGDNGIKQAYIKLLNGPGDILHYLPVQYKEEEDPLRDFRVQYFRERQRRKMFSRVLAHDTPLGRRYQSRDAFEFRKTVLASETEYPFTFEKIITGDRIACIDHTAKTACVIRYPELADIEKTLFEAIWRQVQQKAPGDAPLPLVTKEEPKKEGIALTTETLSRAREFFLSPKSLIAFGVCALLAAGVTYVFYLQTIHLNKLRLQERVKSIVTTAALQFSANDIEQLHTWEDIQKPQYAKVIHLMNRIRRENDGVKYMYIMRPTDELHVWKFVADADSLNPSAVIDLNGDGVINNADHLTPPGEAYQQSPNEKWNVNEVAVSDNFVENQWGAFITGAAPIRDDSGKGIALLGVDIEADQLNNLTDASFWPVAYFVFFFALFVFIRFIAFNPRFVTQMIKVQPNTVWRKTVYTLILFIMAIYWLFFILHFYLLHLKFEEVGKRLMVITATAASEFDPNDLEKLRFARDMKTPEYQRVFIKLNQIREQDKNIQWAYILRPVEIKNNQWEFIADADSNYFLNSSDDYDSNGELSDNEENVWPGLQTPNEWQVLKDALIKPSYSRNVVTDQWGTYITGAAPIKDKFGNVVGVLGLDFLTQDISLKEDEL